MPDYPKPGISFKDITPLLLDAELSKLILDELVERAKLAEPDFIAGIESRGFLFGPQIARRLGIGFLPIRKAGKLPRQTLQQAYALEYGEAVIEVHQEDITAGGRVLIHDDLLATGGTALAAARLVEMAEAKVCGFNFIVELEFLEGEGKLQSIAPSYSLVSY